MDFLPETFPISSAPGTGPGGATTIDDIEGLAAALAEKYSDDNNPAIADIIGLVTALAGKQATPLGAADMPTGIDAAKLANGSVSNAELQYINSLTSNAQDQLDAKASTSALTSGLAGKSDTGHSHAASAITSGTLGLAQGGTNADLSASGAATHFLAQAADHSIGARAIAVTDLPDVGSTGEFYLNLNSQPRFRLRGTSAPSEAGACFAACGLVARAPSTVYDQVLAIDSKYTGQMILVDDVQTGATMTSFRILNGAINGSISGDSTCYKLTGTPTGDQAKIEIAAGYIKITTGDGYSRSLGLNALQFGVKP